MIGRGWLIRAAAWGSMWMWCLSPRSRYIAVWFSAVVSTPVNEGSPVGSAGREGPRSPPNPPAPGAKSDPGRDEVFALHLHFEHGRCALVPHLADRSLQGHVTATRKRSKHFQLLRAVQCRRGVEGARRTQSVGSPLRQRQSKGRQYPKLILEDEVQLGRLGAHGKCVQDRVALGVRHGAGPEIGSTPIAGGLRSFRSCHCLSSLKQRRERDRWWVLLFRL